MCRRVRHRRLAKRAGKADGRERGLCGERLAGKGRQSELTCRYHFLISRWQNNRRERNVKMSASRGAKPMAERKTEEESPAQPRPDAPQLQKLEIDFETLVVAGIVAVIVRSPKRRTNPWAQSKAMNKIK